MFTPPKFDSQISHISKKMDIFNERKYFFSGAGDVALSAAHRGLPKRGCMVNHIDMLKMERWRLSEIDRTNGNNWATINQN